MVVRFVANNNIFLLTENHAFRHAQAEHLLTKTINASALSLLILVVTVCPIVVIIKLMFLVFALV